MILTEEEIGDNIDLEKEATYRCSDGSYTTTVSVDRLLKYLLDKLKRLGMLKTEPKEVNNG